MAYDVIKYGTLAGGLRGNAPAWGRLVANHDALYEAYAPPITYGASSEADPLVVADTADASLSETYQPYLRWIVPRDLDNVPVAVTVIARCTANQVGVKLVSGANEDSIGVASPTWIVFTLTVTPDGSPGPAPLYGREVRLEMAATTELATAADILTVSAHYAPTSVPSGVQPSGWARMASSPVTDADEPLTSERVARLINGPVYLAKDRPACVASMLQDTADANRGGGRWSTLSSDWVTAGKVSIPPQPKGTPPMVYGVAVYTGGDDTELNLTVPGTSAGLSFSGAGWSYATFAHNNPGAPLSGLVRLRTTGIKASLHTLQVFRIGEVS